MLQALEQDAFQPTHIRRAGPRWFVRLGVPLAVQEGFGLAPEVLVVVVDGEVRARDLHHAADEVVNSELRLDGNLFVVADATPYPPLHERLERLAGHSQRVAFVPSAGVWPSLKRVLREALPGFDAYEDRDPVRGAQLIGRSTELSELKTRITRGDAVAVLGLRKMGKTSLVRAVTDWWDPISGLQEASSNTISTQGVAIIMDAGTVMDRSVDAVSDELIRSLRRRMNVAGRALPSTTKDSGIAALKDLGEHLLEEGERLCFVFDEYDLLFEGEGGQAPIQGIGRIFRLLRGWSQLYRGRVSMVLIGRDPSFLSLPELDGVTSPLLAWCTPFWIGPLGRDAANELLRKIGKRVGLDVGASSAVLALRWTGGHPLLHRQFGSALRGAVRRHEAGWGVATDPMCEQGLAAFLKRDAVLDVMREIQALLTKRFPDGWRVLEDLAAGRPWPVEAEEMERERADALRLIERFGLASADRPLPEVARWYVTTIAGRGPVERRAS